MPQLQPPSNAPYISPVLRLDGEWVTLLFTIFPIPSQVFGLAGSAAPSLAITGLWGFSNGAFEEITLFSSRSREKTEDILAESLYSQSHQVCLTHLVAKISSYLMQAYTHMHTFWGTLFFAIPALKCEHLPVIFTSWNQELWERYHFIIAGQYLWLIYHAS